MTEMLKFLSRCNAPCWRRICAGQGIRSRSHFDSGVACAGAAATAVMQANVAMHENIVFRIKALLPQWVPE